MPVDYNIPTLDDRLQQVVDNIDVAGNGFMRLLDAMGSVLSSFQLARPMGSVSNGVLTFNGLSLIDPAASASGEARGARVEDAVGTVVISGLLVDGPTPDIILTPTATIQAGQTVAITAATIRGN